MVLNCKDFSFLHPDHMLNDYMKLFIGAWLDIDPLYIAKHFKTCKSPDDSMLAFFSRF